MKKHGNESRGLFRVAKDTLRGAILGLKGKIARDPANLMEGLVEIWVMKKDEVLSYDKVKNIILSQGQAEILRTLCTTSPATTPRVITRMAIGDQGTIPSDSTVPKVPVKIASSLFHEIYRKDIDQVNPTLFSQNGFQITGNTTLNSTTISGLASIAGITKGMTVVGTGVPQGAVVTDILSPTSISISLAATSNNSGVVFTFVGVVNECQFIATFNAYDVPLSAYSNQSQPRINEVGLVIIDPTAVAGLSRVPVVAPALPESDEVLMSIRCFKSVPFEAANEITVTIKYTIFME